MKTKKRILVAALFVAALAGVTAGATGEVTAKPSGHSIYVDGQKVNAAAYTINSNNYFKLRDIAAIVNGTPKQFEVTWNGAEKRIDLTSNKAYNAVGGEMGVAAPGVQTAKNSTAVVYKDGAKATYTGFTIANNNYYKLRDVCDAFGIGVTWNGETRRVDLITTDAPVNPETPVKPVAPVEPDVPVITMPEPEVNTPESLGLPPVGEYTDFYKDFLKNSGEEIVTCTIKYLTYEHFSGKEGAEGGFVAAIRAFGPVHYLNGSNSPFDESGPFVKTVYIDKSGSGTFTLDMPKSLYEKTLKDNVYFSVESPNAETIKLKTDYGKHYEIGGSTIEKMHVRENRPAKLRVELYDMDYR